MPDIFSEIIFTHCVGIDILNKAKQNQSRDYHIYSIDERLMNDPAADLAFLDAVMQRKFPFERDAYGEHQFAYYAPSPADSKRLLVRGSSFQDKVWRHADVRPGKFINQGYYGYFTNIPSLLLSADNLWDGYEKGLDYYNVEQPKAESNFDEPKLDTKIFVEIRNFLLADNRIDILKSVIVFLFEEFSKPPHERKFLIIQDNDTDVVIKWIAAIHFVFPALMASCISFSTKLYSPNDNTYVVGDNEKLDYFISEYRGKNNKVNPKKIRRMHMITGINKETATQKNSEDYRLITELMPIRQDSPYYDYCQFITKFDVEHYSFLLFSKSLLAKPSEPNASLLKIFDVYRYMPESLLVKQSAPNAQIARFIEKSKNKSKALNVKEPAPIAQMMRYIETSKVRSDQVIQKYAALSQPEMEAVLKYLEDLKNFKYPPVVKKKGFFG